MASLSPTKPLLPTSLIQEFPNPTWIENLHIRSNGDILISSLSKPELYLVSTAASTSAGTSPVLLHSFDPSLALLGIAEISPDIFFVVAGDYSIAKSSNTTGSYSIWSVDLTAFDGSSQSASNDVRPVVKLVTHLPEASFLNGMTKLPSSPTVLIADSTLGVVWSVNTETSKYEIAVDVEEMKIPPPPGFPIAINGVKVKDDYLYWTNTGRMIVCRVKIDGEGKKAGDVEVLAKGLLGDDFTIDERGLWVAQSMFNTVALVTEKGDGGWEWTVVAGSKDQVICAGGTACAFGRKAGDEKTLYLSTNGGMSAPVDGKTVGGSIVAIKT
jgi:hypothetical protein